MYKMEYWKNGFMEYWKNPIEIKKIKPGLAFSPV